MIKIPLYRGEIIVGQSCVDDQDDWACGMRWTMTAYGYARNGYKNLLHRLVARCPEGLMVDHADHDKLNNQRENLRICSNTENQWNRNLGESRKYKGVHWSKAAGKWQVRVQKDGETFYLGLFDSPVDAALAYDTKARELFGEFARTNESLGILVPISNIAGISIYSGKVSE